VLAFLASALLAGAPVAAAVQTPKGQLLVTRQDLAEAVQRVDALLAPQFIEQRMEGAALRAANERFDRISLQFFTGNMAAVYAALEEWERELQPSREEAPALRIELGTMTSERGRVVYSPRGTWRVDAEPRRVRVCALKALPARRSTTVSARLEAVALFAGGEHETSLGSAPLDLVFDAGGALVPVELELTPRDLAESQRDFASDAAPLGARLRLIEVGAEGSLERVLDGVVGGVVGGVLAVTELSWGQPLATLRAALEERLAAAARDAADALDEDAVVVLRARLALLVDEPSAARSREFLLSGPALAEAVEREARAVLAGGDPYRGVEGGLWRTVRHGERDLALRVYCPPARADSPEARWPLVVAFHGAGGDENFLFELAGDGYLERLARESGALVVCPSTTDFARGGAALDALLTELAADYPLDPERVFLFGHSMGSGAVANLCRARPDAIARAVSVAGFGTVDEGSPPILVIAGEVDPIARAARLQRSCAAAQARGAAVEFRVLADQGHTLMLPAAMEQAFEFFGLERAR